MKKIISVRHELRVTNISMQQYLKKLRFFQTLASGEHFLHAGLLEFFLSKVEMFILKFLSESKVKVLSDRMRPLGLF